MLASVGLRLLLAACCGPLIEVLSGAWSDLATPTSIPPAMRLLPCLLGLATAAITDAGAACTFVPNCDYGKGSRDSAPATTKEECCTACEANAKSGCVAGVFEG